MGAKGIITNTGRSPIFAILETVFLKIVFSFSLLPENASDASL